MEEIIIHGETKAEPGSTGSVGSAGEIGGSGAGSGTGEGKVKVQRQSYSCAECKRLKLKCSRSWPCTSCEKRGCAQICPSGTIRTGKGKRLILADTEELHQRISLLEIALAQSHAQNSTSSHPLLSSTYLYSPRDPTRIKAHPPASASGPTTALTQGPGRQAIRPTEASGTANEPSNSTGAEGEEDVVDSAFGTLTIGVGGEARFVGSFAGSEYLRTGTGTGEDESEGVGDEDGTSDRGDAIEGQGGVGTGQRVVLNRGNSYRGGNGLATPPDSAAIGNGVGLGFPPTGIHHQYGFGGYSAPGIRIGGYADDVDVEGIRRELPDWEGEGRDLVQNYWDNAYWMSNALEYEGRFVVRGVSRVGDSGIGKSLKMEGRHGLLVTCQREAMKLIASAYDLSQTVHPHKLAVVFLMMAVGVMFDLHRPPFDQRGGELFALGQACLSAVGLEHATPSTVRALHLCGTYVLNDKHGSGAEIFWPVLGTAVKVAYSLGLHRDGEVFGLSPEETEERRLVWWELVTYDRLQATCFARPAGIASRSTDTKMPTVTDSTADTYHNTKYRIVELMEKVIDVQTQITPIPYSLIKSLDTELVEFKKSLPETLLPSTSVPNLPLDPHIPPHLVMHRLTVRLLIAQCRLLLSRPFFARALSDNPDDPSFSKHGASFVALYEAAQEIIQVVQHLVIYHPSLIARWWFFWFHAFSSACCLDGTRVQRNEARRGLIRYSAAIVIRAPTSVFATPAFDGLTIVCDIAAAAREGCRAKKGLPVLIRLRARAQESMRKSGRHGAINASSGSGRPSQPGRQAGYVVSHRQGQRAPTISSSRGGMGSAGGAGANTNTGTNTNANAHANPDEAVDMGNTDGEDDDLGHLSGRSKLRRVRESNVRSGSRGSADSPDTGSLGLGSGGVSVGGNKNRRSGSQSQTSPSGAFVSTSPAGTGGSASTTGIGAGAVGSSTGYTGMNEGYHHASGTGGVASGIYNAIGASSNLPDFLVSPRSTTSVATSTTLAENTWEGVVPPPPPPALMETRMGLGQGQGMSQLGLGHLGAGGWANQLFMPRMADGSEVGRGGWYTNSNSNSNNNNGAASTTYQSQHQQQSNRDHHLDQQAQGQASAPPWSPPPTASSLTSASGYFPAGTSSGSGSGNNSNHQGHGDLNFASFLTDRSGDTAHTAGVGSYSDTGLPGGSGFHSLGGDIEWNQGNDMDLELDLNMDLDMSMALGFGAAGAEGAGSSGGGATGGSMVGFIPGSEWDWDSFINGNGNGGGGGYP